jgi:hypothetical protein
MHGCRLAEYVSCAMTNRFGVVLHTESVRWAAAEGVSETVIAGVLLLHERSVDEVASKLRPDELGHVIRLVGRSPSCYPPGTLDTLKQRKALISPPPSDSVPSNISAKKQAWRPQHSADWPRRRHTRTPAGLGGSPSPIQSGNGAGPPRNAESLCPIGSPYFFPLPTASPFLP